MIFFNVITILIAISALVVSVKAWQKNRSIYGIERKVIRQVTGNYSDIHLDQMSEQLNKELSSGKYTVLAVLERSKADRDWELLLGKIKK